MLIVSINLSYQKKKKKTVDTIPIIFDNDQRKLAEILPFEIPMGDGRNPFEPRELQVLSISGTRETEKRRRRSQERSVTTTSRK